jgi:hypothetical protein
MNPRRHRHDGGADRSPETLSMVVVDLQSDELAESVAVAARHAWSDFVDPDVADAIAEWHRRFIPPAAPSRPVMMERRKDTGHPEEILVTMRCRPPVARDIAAAVHVFSPDLRRLRVDVSTLRRGRRELTWDAVLRAPIWRRRPATLRLWASPSSNVSVLTLTPKKPHKVARRGFIRAGVRALHDLSARIDAEAEATASAARSH